MNSGVVGRLAPSPTGALHLGNARSFLIAWLSARQQAGQLLLRIEDIDSPRIKPGSLQSTLDDLRWLGLDWDGEPMVQSHRLQRYREVLDQLLQSGRVYACTCSRSEVARAASAPHESSLAMLEGPIYPGTCRPSVMDRSVMDRRVVDRSADPTVSSHSTENQPKILPSPLPSPGSAPSPDKFAWRWHFLPEPLQWSDRLYGIQRATPAEQLGDFVVARGDGTPAYQLAVIVDDHDSGVTEVVRGADLIFSTYRQLSLLQQLGWPAPSYCHVPLMVGSDGRRLAKRHGDTRLSRLRERGFSAEQVVGYLAWTLGMQSEVQPLSASDLVGRLELTLLPKRPTVVTADWTD